MLFISLEDFFDRVKGMQPVNGEQEKELARAMAQGDVQARQQLICSYLPLVAALVRKAPPEIQTLHTVYSAIATVERGVDTFDFLHSNEPFSHHLNWRLRQCITRCIAQH